MSHGFARAGFAQAPVFGVSWTRPEGWLPFTRPGLGDNKIVGLYAIQNGDNFFALDCGGQFTVDWGDGTSPQSYTGSVEKNLSWASYPSATLHPRGYRQAVITITPTVGQFSTVNFALKHASAAAGDSTGWLDVIVSAPTASSILFYKSGGQVPRMLEQFEQVGTTNVTSMYQTFYGCSALQSIPALNTTNVTSMSNMFQNCSSLQSVPALNTATVTSMSNMFQNCSALQSIPALNTTNVTTMSGTFNLCPSLRAVELTGCTVPVSVASCRLDATALDALYTSLGTVSSATITVTNNPGVTADTPSIATAKGWTVVGS